MDNAIESQNIFQQEFVESYVWYSGGYIGGRINITQRKYCRSDKKRITKAG
jgi:hypothetical protein